MKPLFAFFMLAIFFVQHAVGQSAPDPVYSIAYSANDDEHRDIYLTNPEGNSTKRITDFTGGNGYSAWSPDGKRLAFYAKYDDRKTWSIHTINSDGTDRKRLTHKKDYWDNSPTWSADGSKIVFARAFKNAEEVWQYQIWEMNADGTNQRQIEGLQGGGPYYSATGQIVYHSQPGPSEIYIANADGSNQRQLTNNDAEDWHPEVSPDGTKITFMSDRDGNREIYVMNLDGSDQKRLTSSEDEADWYPSWSPDGKEILVSASKNEGEIRRVYRMKADGSDIRLVVEGGGQAAWLKRAQNFPPLEDRYFGQELPGMVPVQFSPEILSPEGRFEGGNWSPDMRKFYFNRKYGRYAQRTFFVIEYENGQWGNESETDIHYPRYSGDGDIIYRGNKYRDRTETGWSELKSMGAPFTDKHIMGIAVSDNGTYYFDEFERPDTVGAISFSRLVNGQYEPRQKMGREINTGTWIAHPVIAPDESYLMWDVVREDGYGMADLYISFRRKDGSWCPAINMGPEINTQYQESGVRISPDGKYLLFSRSFPKTREDGSTYMVGVPYWVDAKILEKLRPDDGSENSKIRPIAYGSSGIKLNNAAGTSEVVLTVGDHGYPAWSPDGKTIAFYGYHDNKKTWSIHSINSDGTNYKRLTHTKFKWDNMPCWSPDGTQIVFAREYWDEAEVRHYELWVMNADGSGERQLTALSGGGPRFIPDGRLLYHSEHKDKESEISITTLDGRNIIHLTDNEAEEWDPKLSPDGTQIVFTSNRDGNHEVYVMNVDGTDQRRLTNNKIDDYGPVWSPDGHQIVYQSKGDNGKEDDPTGLYIMNVDGSGKRRIVGKGWQPAWRHKGK